MSLGAQTPAKDVLRHEIPIMADAEFSTSLLCLPRPEVRLSSELTQYKKHCGGPHWEIDRRFGPMKRGIRLELGHDVINEYCLRLASRLGR